MHGDYHQMHKICNIHGRHNDRGHVLDNHFARHTSFLTNVVLATREGHMLSDIRREARAILCEPGRFDFNTSDLPSPRFRSNLLAVLDAFLPPTSRENRVRRAIILSICNGDATICNGRVVHFERACGSCTSRDACLKKYTKVLVPAIIAQCPSQFPGRNFVGSEDAPSFVGLGDGINGLFSESLVRCLFTLGGVAPKAKAPGTEEGDADEWRAHSEWGKLAAASNDAADPAHVARNEEMALTRIPES